jgi:rare lipoprotein A
MTAAHRTLPFGTLVRVTNLRNNRSIDVRITNRGPFIKGRIIDLSPAAARQLHIGKSGIVRVRIEPSPARKKLTGNETEQSKSPARSERLPAVRTTAAPEKRRSLSSGQAFDLRAAAGYHLFIRRRKKMTIPASRARMLMSQNGQVAFSMGRGKATFIENSPMTSVASIIATVQMVKFLMS